ncbi:MAG: hypothetical protein EPO09_13800 [Aquabacterium sp.]|uniref:hypothetical protein n=1 Tax=Aquabacterium sp. TaxID=1872578 RepID=UPI0012043ED3|nr:hypothetical protein [Aquabacterium sp.]TAK93060.1 MAG: hypothetical protein EPO09_13800 [Aquabacterium sp.]
MSNALPSSLDAVYQRTHKGQIVAAGKSSLLGHEFMLWLRMLNGLTPTRQLMNLAGASPHDALRIVDRLRALGLIEQR